jgi:hypothetical protein
MSFWLGVALLLIGFAAGLFIGGKYITSPSNQYSFDKIKVKGEGNQVTSQITASLKEAVQKPKRRILQRIFKSNHGKSKETQQKAAE